jgi:hypothetical protein
MEGKKSWVWAYLAIASIFLALSRRSLIRSAQPEDTVRSLVSLNLGVVVGLELL